jgi:minor extracellular serine protease Vpr
LLIASDTIRYTLLVESAVAGNSRPHIWLRIRNPFTSYLVDLEATAVSGEVHFWNVTDLTTGVGNWGMPFQSAGAGYTAGDNQYGIGEPAVAASAIGVAAYSARVEVSPGVMGGGFLASFSSTGPLVGGAQKPDIAAPGVNVLSAVNSFTDAAFTQVQTVTFQGKAYPYARASGTSMSGPVVAGIVALMLEANPGLTAAEVRSILIQTARQDQNTGVLPVEGHPRWGHGKVYALAAVFEALNMLGQDSDAQSSVRVYPNPSRGWLQISGVEHSFAYRVLDLQGREVQRGVYTPGLPLKLEVIPSGIYVLAGDGNTEFKPLRFLLLSDAE